MVIIINKRLERLEIMLGEDAVRQLWEKRVAVFGIGGVGGYTAEALARSGVGHIDVIDSDRIDITNLNRQIIALDSTVGRYKTEVIKERIKDINPDIEVKMQNIFYLPENADSFDLKCYDYIVDAIDTVTAKVELVVRAVNCDVPIISSMGTGNKLNPQMLEVEDIYKTSVCPLAKVMRYELKRKGVEKLKVVYSKEKPFPVKGGAVGSYVCVPATAGLIMASVVIEDLMELSTT